MPRDRLERHIEDDGGTHDPFASRLYLTSKRSRFVTFAHALTKSRTNRSLPSDSASSPIERLPARRADARGSGRSARSARAPCFTSRFLARTEDEHAGDPVYRVRRDLVGTAIRVREPINYETEALHTIGAIKASNALTTSNDHFDRFFLSVILAL